MALSSAHETNAHKTAAGSAAFISFFKPLNCFIGVSPAVLPGPAYGEIRVTAGGPEVGMLIGVYSGYGLFSVPFHLTQVDSAEGIEVDSHGLRTA
jgi:hypothetical protein